jgi:hypothetical protein
MEPLLIHFAHKGAAFCQDPNATVLDPRLAHVTCPLCRQMAAGQALLHGAVNHLGAAFRQYVGQLQGDPRVQTLREYASTLFQMNREAEAARQVTATVQRGAAASDPGRARAR